jgi:hypothetical protein
MDAYRLSRARVISSLKAQGAIPPEWVDPDPSPYGLLPREDPPRPPILLGVVVSLIVVTVALGALLWFVAATSG